MYLALKKSQGQGQGLQPASKTLALNRSIGLHASMGTGMHSQVANEHMSTTSKSLGSVLSSSIHKLSERLYRTAAVQKERLDKVRRAEEDAAERELRESQFKLSDASRALAGNYKSTSEHDDITLRLYEEGCKDLEKRKKAAEARPEPAAIETWSCVKCGSYHNLPIPADRRSARGRPASRTCPACGWEAGACVLVCMFARVCAWQSLCVSVYTSDHSNP